MNGEREVGCGEILLSCEWAQDKISNLYGMIPVRGGCGQYTDY